jgi:23S rRNA (uracil1939-C5)-methyltransferase
LKPITARRRDLAREPLSARELRGFDAVVLDPPRAGAAAQAEALARSDVATAVMAACNPATFARDARILLDGGFGLAAVTPVDQFLWSPHVETVATFKR